MPPDQPNTPGDSNLPIDPADAGDMRIVSQAVRQGWDVPEQAYTLIPRQTILVALGRDKNGKATDQYTERQKAAAARLLLAMDKANAGNGAGRIPVGSIHAETVNLQQNIGQPPGTEQAVPWIVANLELVADFFGKARETMKEWRAKGMPGIRATATIPGRYDLSEILRWKEVNIGSSGRNDGTADVARAEADRRKAVAEAEMKELKTEEFKGQLIDLDDVVREFNHETTTTRAHLEQIPDRATAQLPPCIECGAQPGGDDKRRFRTRLEEMVDQITGSRHEELMARVGQS